MGPISASRPGSAGSPSSRSEAPCRHNSRTDGLPRVVLRQREGVRPQVGRSAAGGDPVRPVRRRGTALPAGQCRPGRWDHRPSQGPRLLDLFATMRSGFGDADRGRPQLSDLNRPDVGEPVRSIRVPQHGGLASVIVPCFNQREFTRLCLQALFRHTRTPWELIVIDNGSTDGTAEYLAGVQDAAPVPVTVIRNSRNVGFPAAINQGLKAARGGYLVLLNNDAVVTDGWLDQLIALTQVRPRAGAGSGTYVRRRAGRRLAPRSRLPTRKIGLVGPMSNYATPPQLVEDVPYRDLDEMHAFARRWRDEHRGKWFTVPKLSGFCVLMTRAVYDAIGGLDERFGLGLFDDDDLAERARRAGFELAVAHDLFVHHFGSRTFVGNGIDAEALLQENARRFADKWGARPAPRPAGRAAALDRRSGALAATRAMPIRKERCRRRRRARIVRATVPVLRTTSLRRISCRFPRTTDHGRRPGSALTMIVRDEEKNLPHCLASVKGIFDEIVVVDTGSVDRTVEIAREFGARVFDFVWVDDFAAARNAALARATGDYAFWLDADDVVEPPEREKLAGVARRLAGMGTEPPSWCACACDPGEDGSGGETVVDHIRLFPVREDIRWTYRVHEQILPSLRRARVPVRWTDLTVRHTGYSDRALRARKLRARCPDPPRRAGRAAR